MSWEVRTYPSERFPGNDISFTAHIGPHVTMGVGNKIGPGVVILGQTTIGNNNSFHAHAVIGDTPEKHGYLDTHGMVIIGNNNVIRPHVTIDSGTTPEGTEIGNNNLFMSKTHLGHDCRIEDNVTISSCAVIGGHSVIMRNANIGLGAITHQFTVVGSCAMLGANSFVPKGKHIAVGNIYVGSPAKFLKRNEIGLERSGLSQEEVQADVVRYGRLIGIPA